MWTSLFSSVNKFGESPLYLAVQGGLEAAICCLLEISAFCTCRGPDGLAALHAAVICKHQERRHDTIREVAEIGWTPLHYAVSIHDIKAVQKLLRHVTSAAHISDKDGLFPLHFAASYGAVRVMKTLIENCSYSWEPFDNKGYNALHVAVLNVRADVVSYILQMPKLVSLKKGIRLCILLQFLISTEHHFYVLLEESSQLTCKTICNVKRRRDKLKQKLTDQWTKANSESYDSEKNKFNVNLLVATLVATATFAVAFQLPGGLEEDGPN
ncbi:PGG domain [Dillenia turbinata]|uniref:PGG domain n=1 Tax=Dillenia turbinata TaxID=194707 RepID=A0AAN8UM83_9MAGN